MYSSRFLPAAALLLAGCSVVGLGGTSPQTVGLVVGDEPYAVQAGAAALAQGGSAADAATATYFALAVTYPVAAGLGGGGVCLVRDPERGKTEAFEFLARDPARGGDYAVPGNVLGFSLLQASYGRLPWQRVISPAEGFAAAGFPISRALATRLADSQDVIRLDAELAGEFLDETGAPKAAGTLAIAPALAKTLSAIRSSGPSGFYRGPIANGIVTYASAQNGAIAAAELAAYSPSRELVAARDFRGETVFLPPENIGAGKFAATLLSHLVHARGDTDHTGGLSRSVAAATKSALDAYGIASLPRDLGATGFAAIDARSQAVACAVTMNGPFGSGHTAAGTGVTLARAPHSGAAGLAAAFLTPVIATSGDDLSLAGSGAGGPNGSAAIAYALSKLAEGSDVTVPGALHSTGIAPYDTVNAIACQNGICAALPDPGAYGLGAAAR